MCININIDIDPLKIIKETWKPMSSQFQYLRDPKNRITQLIDAREDLRHKRDHTSSAIERDKENRTPQIENWLIKVTRIDDKVSKFIDDQKNRSFRWCINRRAVRRLADVNSLAEDFSSFSAAFKLPPAIVEEIPGDPPIGTPTVNAHLSELQTYLQEEGSGIIGIWGMGGVGKTTLLRCINNDLLPGHSDELLRSSEARQSKLMFDHTIWAVVSKNYKPSDLRLLIANRLGLKQSSEKDHQAIEIHNFLKKKSFVIFLDDLWQKIELAEIGIPQSLSTEDAKQKVKQKVVFTTRDNAVCAIMQVKHKIKIECLTEKEAWMLFKASVGEETLQEHPMIREQAKIVAKECDGLPLALKLIGSAMRSKTNTYEWKNAIDLLRSSRPDEIYGKVVHDDEKIFTKLKFSYDNLANDNLQKCFLLCSLWPEDYSISKNDLIECWMGHGFVDESNCDNINKVYDRGNGLISELQGACLLEPGNYKNEQVKMHDVVRDLALWIASDCGGKLDRFVVLESTTASKNLHNEVQRISLFHCHDLSDSSFLPTNLSKLETLMVHNSYSFDSKFSAGFFKGTPALTYLDLSYTVITNLPQEIGLLVNVRYLNLSNTFIKSLPLELRNLCKLRFLLLRKLKSISIPCDVLEKLVELSVIDMTDTWCDNWKEIAKMPGIVKGLGIGITLKSISDLLQLAKCNILTWRLELSELMGLINEPLQLLSLSLLASDNINSSLQMLKINNCKSLEEVSMKSDGYGAIQKWSLSRLVKLELESLPELKEVVWRGLCPAEMLPNLTMLTISFCHKLSNISWVRRLPSLELLNVKDCIEMEQIIGEEENGVGTADRAFPSLKCLSLFSLENLRVFGGPFKFPSLENLIVMDCPKMNMLPFGAEMAEMKLKTTIIGARSWWENLNMDDVARAALEPYFQSRIKISEDSSSYINIDAAGNLNFVQHVTGEE